MGLFLPVSFQSGATVFSQERKAASMSHSLRFYSWLQRLNCRWVWLRERGLFPHPVPTCRPRIEGPWEFSPQFTHRVDVSCQRGKSRRSESTTQHPVFKIGVSVLQKKEPCSQLRRSVIEILPRGIVRPYTIRAFCSALSGDWLWNTIWGSSSWGPSWKQWRFWWYTSKRRLVAPRDQQVKP